MANAIFGAAMKKECFHFEERVTFLNHGSYGAIPIKIRDRQKQLHDELNDNPDLFYRQTEYQLYTQARDAAARFVGADPENLVFVQNATTGVNSVLKALPWRDGDEILTTVHTYRAVANACRKVAEFSTGGHIHQFDIRFPIKDEQQVVESMTSHLDKHPKIRLVVLDHITSPTALVFPLREMIAECRKRGVLVFIDGAHAPGQVEINLEELQPDFYTGNFHKWVFTPRGCAILWIAKQHHDWCTPLVTSHMYKKGVQLEYFMQGTRDNIPYFLVPEALKFFSEIGGMEKIHQYTKALLDNVTSMISDKLGTPKPEIPKSMEAPYMRLVLLPEYEGYPAGTHEGAERLILDLMRKHRINTAVCPAQDQLYLRLSATVYNQLSDYEKIAEVLNALPRK